MTKTARPIVIFGTGDIAELAHVMFEQAGEREIAGFTVDAGYRDTNQFRGLPLVDFEDVESRFPTSSFDLFLALSYSRINTVRKEKFESAKAKGYNLASFISPNATILTEKPIGENCFIFEDNTVQPFVEIGDNVTLWSGNHIGHHSIIGDHTFIASHVVISGGVKIGEQCFIGVNATLRDHITIGDRCVLGAGTLILRNAKPDGLYIGTATKRSDKPSSRLKKI